MQLASRDGEPKWETKMFHVLRNKRRVLGAGLAVAAMSIPIGVAVAGNTTTTMLVSATVLTTCLVVATPLAFGVYSGAQADSTATITVTCTATSPWNIGLDPGTASGATVSTRAMQFGSESLNYGLYRDASRSLNWGQTIGTDTLAGTGTGLPQINTVYGRVPAGQYPSPGVYLDTITATLTF